MDEDKSALMKNLWENPEYRQRQTISRSKKRGRSTEYLTIVCEYCGKVFEAAAWNIKRRFCSPQCYGKYISENHLGTKAFNWRGGKKKSFHNPYDINFDVQLRDLIRKRDKYTCQICGISEKVSIVLYGRKLHIHHIDYNKSNSCQFNLISLCTSCHIKTNYNRAMWKIVKFSYFLHAGIIDLDNNIIRKFRFQT
jgi:hypothetical protein